MTDRLHADVLAKGDRPRTPAYLTVPATYARPERTEATTADLGPSIEQMRAELEAGNADAAIRIGHLVAGRAARLGERRLASTTRRAICMARFHILTQAAELVAEAARDFTVAREPVALGR